MNIILSTRNPSKAEQIKAMFIGLPVTVQTLDEAKIAGEAVEDGSTLQENALKKALYAWGEASPKAWAMADDTGLFIHALNGEPGIKAARWAGEDARTEDITNFCLSKLSGITDRRATFETCVTLISPEGQQFSFSGKIDGNILTAAKTEPQPKMPYSPLFMPEGTDKVWAEMTVEEENAISHRGRAFRQVVEFLKNTQS